MNMPPIVNTHAPNIMPMTPSGIAMGAPIRVAGAQAQVALGCPPGMGCGSEMMPQLSDSAAAAPMPTWMKVLIGISAISLLAIIASAMARRIKLA